MPGMINQADLSPAVLWSCTEAAQSAKARKHQSRMSAQIFPAAAEGRIKQEGIKRIRIFSNIPKGSVFQREGRD
ncbi:hypothetical protein GQ457_11G024770 [Hibiscus cannabinus]